MAPQADAPPPALTFFAAMPDITIYTSDRCSFCDRAKGLLEARGAAYEEIHLDRSDTESFVRLAKLTGHYTVPQIFVGGTHVGGFTELHALDRAGMLAEMLSR